MRPGLEAPAPAGDFTPALRRRIATRHRLQPGPRGLLLVEVDVLVVAEAAVLRGLAEIDPVLEVEGPGAALPGVSRFEAVVDVDLHLHRRRVQRRLVVEPLVDEAARNGAALD